MGPDVGKEQLELEVLRLRDQHLGRTAEDGERVFRYSLLKFEFDELRKESRSIRQEMKKQRDLLEENMTRAYVAEKRLAELRIQHASVVVSLENQLDALRNSRSFRIGRAVLSPVRLVRRIFGR